MTEWYVTRYQTRASARTRSRTVTTPLPTAPGSNQFHLPGAPMRQKSLRLKTTLGEYFPRTAEFCPSTTLVLPSATLTRQTRLRSKTTSVALHVPYPPTTLLLYYLASTIPDQRLRWAHLWRSAAPLNSTVGAMRACFCSYRETVCDNSLAIP